MSEQEIIESKMKYLDDLVAVLDSTLFKTLSEPVRVEILRILIQIGRADIGEIAERLPQDRSVISRHLALMNEAGILTTEKEGRHVYYEINGKAFIDKVENIASTIRTCLEECPGNIYSKGCCSTE